MSPSDPSSTDQITNLLNVLHDPIAVSLRARWNAFNPFRVLKVEMRELRHTTTLAWLLNPRESHGLGDQFLRGFLKSVCASTDDHRVLLSYETDEDASVRIYPELRIEMLHEPESSLLDEGRGADEQFSVDRLKSEDRRLDILVRGNRWAVAIEAKVGANEHDGQLKAYRNSLVSWAEKDAIVLLLVYLTIDEQEEAHPDWKNALWSLSVAQPLRVVLDASGQTDQLGDHQHAFLSSYLEVLSDIAEDANGPVSRCLAALASKHTPALQYLKQQKSRKHKSDVRDISEVAVLYRRNKSLLDRLLEFVDSDLEIRAARISETMAFINLKKVRSDNSYLRFIPPDWLTRFPWISEPTDKTPRVLYEVRNQAKTNRISINLQIWHLSADRYGHERHQVQRVELMRNIQGDPKSKEIFKRAGRTEEDFSGVVHSLATKAIVWDANNIDASKEALRTAFADFIEVTRPLIENYFCQINYVRKD